MSRSLVLLVSAGLLCAAPVRIVLVGDSTVNDEGGWGTGFRDSLQPSKALVLNHALNGRSSKSFRDEGHWQPALDEKPDYVLIQFGHNDQPGKGAARETDPETTYRANLKRYVEESRSAGAKPVLVTSIVRRNFDADGRIVRDPLSGYAAAVRALGAEMNVPVMDLYERTRQQCETLGPLRAERLNAVDKNGKPDRTHLGPRGRDEVGQLAAAEFARAVPEAADWLIVHWSHALGQRREFYRSPEAVRIADNLIAYQHPNGGWNKNIDMAQPLTAERLAAIAVLKTERQTTIDNDATYSQLRYLARVYSATGESRFAAAFRRGLEYLLAAQYGNGGWPQFYPLRDGYWSHITYNDDAMIGVMELLRSVARKEPDFAFLNDNERARAGRAIERGIDCILKTQVIVAGKRTVWCAQHDEVTLKPAQARSYELVSLSGAESVGIIRFLQQVERPTPEIRAAIAGALEWFRQNQITGIRIERAKGDVRVVDDPSAPPLWARFYEIGTNRPIFCDRDGVKKYSLADIGPERRNGYRWYVDRPAELFR